METAPSAAARRWRTAALLAPGAAAVGLGVASPRFVSPDGIEMAVLGRCFWEGGPACVGADPYFWPPAFPALAGLLSLGLELAQAASMASLAAMALTALPLLVIGSRLGGTTAAAATVALLVAVPAFRLHAVTGDARPLMLLALVSAWALALGAPSRGRTVAIGALAALAALARPEGIAGAAALGAWLLWKRRRAALPALLALTALLGPYHLLLWIRAGRPVAGGRTWVAHADGWLATLPPSWIKQALASGADGTPLRVLFSTTPPAPRDTGAPGTGDALTWVADAAGAIVPWWLAALALLGALALLRDRDRWALLVPLALLAAPGVAVLTHWQARDPVLPANNLLLPLLALVLLAATGLAAIGAAAERLTRARLPAGLPVAALAVAALVQGLRSPVPGAEGLQTHQLLETLPQLLADLLPEDATIGTSLGNAPAVHRSGRGRVRLPPPYEAAAWVKGPERPDYILVTDEDLPELSLTIRAIEAESRLYLAAAHARRDDGWAVVFTFADKVGQRR